MSPNKLSSYSLAQYIERFGIDKKGLGPTFGTSNSIVRPYGEISNYKWFKSKSWTLVDDSNPNFAIYQAIEEKLGSVRVPKKVSQLAKTKVISGYDINTLARQ